jgi:sucrose-phosphate synthase
MQFEKEEACRLLKRHPETGKTRTDTTADMSEDLFEGEKGEDAGDPSVAYGDSTTGGSPKTSSVDKLYIVLIRYRAYHFEFMLFLSYCSS